MFLASQFQLVEFTHRCTRWRWSEVRHWWHRRLCLVDNLIKGAITKDSNRISDDKMGFFQCFVVNIYIISRLKDFSVFGLTNLDIKIFLLCTKYLLKQHEIFAQKVRGAQPNRISTHFCYPYVHDWKVFSEINVFR